MARPIVLSNGNLHVGINESGLVSDFYYPYVGFKNHTAGPDIKHRVGIWVDGSISWMGDPGWEYSLRYPNDALIGHIIAKNARIGIILEFDDFVDVDDDAFIRNIQVINLFDKQRDVKLFMHQAFVISDSRSNTDTAQYLPTNRAILHYRGRRMFVISGLYNNKPFDQYTVGLFGIEGREGTFRDAEDGNLYPNNVEHGRVDSTIGFNLDIAAKSSARVQYWIAVGPSIEQALIINTKLRQNGVLKKMSRTADWWHEWLELTKTTTDKLDPKYRTTFIESMMIIKSQIDKRGAIIASTDASLLNYSRDAYAYSWPRDGALVLWPLIRLGYTEEPLNFFSFCKRGLHSDGYLMHKYRSDGGIGSSWHPYVHPHGIVAPPIQEDETALPLFMFAQYYDANPSRSLLKEFYRAMIVPMANFLANYIDEKTGLPLPSYNVWEETFLTSTYTTATVYAALLAASDLAAEAHDQENAVKWRLAASDIQVAASKYLYDEERQIFLKGVDIVDGEITKDTTIDCSSVFGAYIFGLFPDNEYQIKSSIETLEKVFGINNGVLALPRYEGDVYRMHDGISNYWPVTSFWLAQYYIAHGQHEKAEQIIDWINNKSLSTGVMPEQIDPATNQIVAPAPLTWTHAEYVSTLLDLITLGPEEK